MIVLNLRRFLLVVTLTAACTYTTASSAFEELSDLFLSLKQQQQQQSLLNLRKGCGASADGCGEFRGRRMKRQAVQLGDESNLPYEAKSSALPLKEDMKTLNTRYMPTLGNGYIGTTVYSPHLYLNGLFSGEGSDSHRAAVPSLMMGRIRLANHEIENRSTRKYIYNVKEGYFMETIKSEYAYVEYKTYLHQKYIRLFVLDIFVRQMSTSYGGGDIFITYPPLESDDINFREPVNYIGNILATGVVKVAEKPGGKKRQVHMFYQMPLRQITVSGSQSVANYTKILSVDIDEANARSEFEKGLADLQTSENPNWNFFQLHAQAWRDTWKNGMIEVFGSNTNQLIKMVWFSQAHILNSLPAVNPYLPPPYSDVYYGCGRTSIGKGGKGKNYQGHVMWDNEQFILPAVLPFHPNIAKQMLRYRSSFKKEAVRLAQLNNAPGWHFPTASAYTGIEVSPDPCPGNDTLCHWRKYYTTSGVALAIRQFISMTRDREFMVGDEYKGCEMSQGITEFLASRVTWNKEKQRYDLLDATGPDSNHPRVDNDAYLLASINLAIQFGRYFACLCPGNNEKEDVPDEIVKKSFYLNLDYDIENRLHYQFNGFDHKKHNNLKIPEVIMMNQPMGWNYSLEILFKDLHYYKLLLEKNPSSMVLPWFVIGWKFTGEESEMKTMFQKSFQEYTIQPFKIWTEFQEASEADQSVSTTNFLPGAGAFLQSLIYGFAGLKIRPDRLEFHRPRPPPKHKKMVLRNFKYYYNNFTITIELDKVTFELLSINTEFPIVLRINDTKNTEVPLTKGVQPIVMEPPEIGFFLYTTQKENCEQPRDYIYIPFGYFDWVDNSSPRLTPKSLLYVFSTLAAALTLSLLA